MANPAGTPNNLIRFPPGKSGNPGGKPEGARNRLQASFLYALAADFDEHGQKAIESAREKDPMGYVRCVAALMPQKVDVKGPLEELGDEELAQAIIWMRALMTTQGNQSNIDDPVTGAE